MQPRHEKSPLASQAWVRRRLLDATLVHLWLRLEQLDLVLLHPERLHDEGHRNAARPVPIRQARAQSFVRVALPRACTRHEPYELKLPVVAQHVDAQHSPLEQQVGREIHQVVNGCHLLALIGSVAHTAIVLHVACGCRVAVECLARGGLVVRGKRRLESLEFRKEAQDALLSPALELQPRHLEHHHEVVRVDNREELRRSSSHGDAQVGNARADLLPLGGRREQFWMTLDGSQYARSAEGHHAFDWRTAQTGPMPWHQMRSAAAATSAGRLAIWRASRVAARDGALGWQDREGLRAAQACERCPRWRRYEPDGDWASW